MAVLGSAGVGKTAMVVRLLTGRFLHRYDPTLEAVYETRMEVDGAIYELSVLDTAGQEPSHLQNYVSTADVLLLAFALNESSTLDAALSLRAMADRFASRAGKERLPAVLVGTKLDLSRERVVKHCEAIDAAQASGCRYVESSSATGTGVMDAFGCSVMASEVKGRGCRPGAPHKKQRKPRGGPGLLACIPEECMSSSCSSAPSSPLCSRSGGPWWAVPPPRGPHPHAPSGKAI